MDQELTIKLPEEILTEDQRSQILSGISLEGVPVEQKVTIRDSIVEAVLNRVSARLILKFTDMDLEMLSERLASWNSDLALIEFFVLRVPNLDEVIDEEIGLIRTELRVSLPEIFPAS